MPQYLIFFPFRIPFKREITRKLSTLRKRVGLQFMLINFHIDTKLNPAFYLIAARKKKKSQIKPHRFFSATDNAVRKKSQFFTKHINSHSLILLPNIQATEPKTVLTPYPNSPDTRAKV